VAWGNNEWGQCDVPEPNIDFMAASGGGIHSLGLKADGFIVTWGDCSADLCNVPEPNSGFTAIAAGGYHGLGLKALGTTLATLTCAPASGTVPFVTRMTAILTNIDLLSVRRLAGRIDVSLAGGQFYSNWRSGYTNLFPGESYVSSWHQTIAAYSSLIGDNVFTILGADVTPSPWNQPPYPASGGTDTDACTLTGIAQ
jgi:hypothetical protein